MTAIRVELELADGNFTTRMIHAGETLQRFNDNVLRSQPALARAMQAASAAGASMGVLANGTNLAFTSMARVEMQSRSFLQTMRDVTIVVGLAGMAFNNARSAATGWAGEIIKVNAEMESLKELMSSMSKSADPMREAAEDVKALRQQTKDAPFSLHALTDGFVRLKATGIDPSAGALQTFADAVAAAGGGDEKLKRVTLAISQMAGKGVIQMEELRQQLGEALPRATELMARAMGVTYGQLVKDISTGTVQALPAIQALQFELERVFGGASQRMMQTFQGQMTRSKALFQDLALEAGNAGYFEAVKQQVKDLNDFLASPRAAQFARDLGQSLTTVVTALRSVVDFTVAWREELGMVAQVAAVFLGGRLLVGAFTSLSAAIVAARTELALLRTQWVLLGATQAAASASAAGATVATGAAALTSTAAATSLLGRAWQTAMPWLARGALALTAVGPIAVGVGFGLYQLADYFQLFGSRARDAAIEVTKAGAKTREDVDKTVKAHQEALAAVQRLEAERRAYVNRQMYFTRDPNERNRMRAETGSEWDRRNGDRYNQALVEAGVAASRVADAQRNLALTTERQRVAGVMEAVEKELQARSRAYDNDMRELTQAHDKKRAEMLKAGKTTEEIDREFQASTRQRALAHYEEQLAILQKQIDERVSIIKTGSEAERQIAEEQLAAFNRDFVATAERRDAVRQMALGVQKTPKEASVDVMLGKAETHLNRLKAQIEEYRAEMAGASGETAKLTYQLDKAQKFGDPATASIRAMRDELIKTAGEAEKLKGILDGRNAFNDDLDRELQNVRDEIDELTNGSMTRAEKLSSKFLNGGYGGFNPQTPMSMMIQNIGFGFETASRAAEQAARVMQNTVFGSTMLSAGNALVGVVERLAQAWGLFRTGVEGTNLGGLQQLLGAVGNLTAGPSTGLLGPMRNAWTNANAIVRGTYQTAVSSGGANMRGLSPEAQAMVAQIVASGVVKALPIISGYRDAGHNASVGGAQGSQHIHGNAIDIDISKLTDAEKAALLQAAVAAGARGIGIYNGGSSLHLDTRAGAPATWGAGADKYAGHAPGLHPAWAQAPLQALFSGRVPMPGAAAGGSGYVGAAQRVLPAEEAAKLQRLKELEATLAAKQFDRAYLDQVKELNAELASLADVSDKANKHQIAMQRTIATGKFGPDVTEGTEKYKALMALAAKHDAEEARLAETKKRTTAATASETQMTEKLAEARERARSANINYENPLSFRDPASRAKLVADLDAHIEAQKRAYGVDTENYRQALETKRQILQATDGAVALEKAAAARKEAVEINRSLLSDKERREQEIRDEQAKWQELLRNQSLSAEDRVRVEQAMHEKISAMRREAASNDPVARTFREWGDLQARFGDTMVSTLNSSTDALAQMIVTGQTDWRALSTTILTDITRMGLRWMTSGIFTGMTGGKAPGVGKGGGKKGMAGVAHTGGVLGAGGLAMRSISALAFAGAPKFHTGGLVRGLGLGPDEVPIIARRGEGVFTPEQMKAMGDIGRGNSLTFQNNVTVQANGGSREQNADLAAQVGRTVEATTRQIVADEMRKQMRPGGMMR